MGRNLNRAVLIVLTMFLFAGCARMQQAPTPLPHVGVEYESADFWLKRLRAPQAVLLSAEQIREINGRALRTEAGLKDIFAADLLDRSKIVDLFAFLRRQFRSGIYYDQANRRVSAEFFEQIFAQTVEDRILSTIVPAYGLITRATDLRELPTENVLMRKPDDIAFDSLQYARLECGAPVAVLHYSADRRWCLVQAAFAPGWIRVLDVGIGTKEEIKRFIDGNPLVATGEHADIYTDSACMNFAASLPMGARLPIAEGPIPDGVDVYGVLLPARESDGRLKILTGYIRKTADVHPGYLPFTMENLLRQAFKLRSQPYGWGGLFGGRDCSRFIRDVFLCFGFHMPVNSYRQINISEQKIDVSGMRADEKIALLQSLEGRPVLLYMKGHIMLFLGVVGGRAFAIHSTWAYRDRIFFSERLHRIGRVAVSDLSLGEGGDRGSLLDRLKTVSVIQ